MTAAVREALLLSLFEEIRREPNGVSRRSFMARHRGDIEEIDRLISAGIIQCRDGKHLRLPLLGLAELAQKVPDADSVLYLCGHLFGVLQTAFTRDPDEKLSVSEIATLAEMPEHRVAVAFGYLLDAPIWESWHTNPEGLHFNIVMSDRILRYESLSQMVSEMSRSPTVTEDRGAVAPLAEPSDRSSATPTHPFVDPSRLQELRTVTSKRWDLKRLVRMCEELNDAFDRGAYISCSMLVRGIVDHVPPILGCKSFGEVANSYGGTRSFRDSMKHLDGSLRALADGNLHTHARRTESLPTLMQVAFWADLDKLLEEIVRVIQDET